MRKLIAPVVVGLVLAATGCSKPPERGTVQYKQHSDRVVYYTHPCTMHMSTRVNGYISQTCVLWGTRENVIPAEWKLCIKGPDAEGKVTEGCIEVGEARWHDYREGDYYDPAEARR